VKEPSPVSHRWWRLRLARTGGPPPSSIAPEPFAWPPTRFAEWRVRSRLCLGLDVLTASARLVLVVVSTADSIASWRSNYVFLPPTALEHLAGWILLPSWPWMIISAVMVYGLRRERWRDSRRWGIRRRTLVVFYVCLATLVLIEVLGFVIGADKGSLRTLPNGIHQVSTLSLNHAEWTDISTAQFHLWQARFVREDAAFGFFGLFLIGFSLLIRQIRKVTGSVPSTA
jgi:hypothetical protein